MATLIDTKFLALRAAGYTGAKTDMELAWLQDNGATSGSLRTAWDEFLTAAGFPKADGGISDRQFAWLEDLGVTGETLTDQWMDFWTDFTTYFP